jgi:hypothetical protein
VWRVGRGRWRLVAKPLRHPTCTVRITSPSRSSLRSVSESIRCEMPGMCRCRRADPAPADRHRTGPGPRGGYRAHSDPGRRDFSAPQPGRGQGDRAERRPACPGRGRDLACGHLAVKALPAANLTRRYGSDMPARTNPRPRESGTLACVNQLQWRVSRHARN